MNQKSYKEAKRIMAVADQILADQEKTLLEIENIRRLFNKLQDTENPAELRIDNGDYIIMSAILMKAINDRERLVEISEREFEAL